MIEVHEIARPGEPARVRRPLFFIKRMLIAHRAWYARQVAINRRRIEQDVRRFGGRVTWEEG